MKEKRLQKNDILLVMILLVVAGVLFLAINMTKTIGGDISVSVNGEEIMSLPLDKNVTVELSSEYGLEEGYKNVLCIDDGKAYISEANCPDKVCVNRGNVCCEGETIVCLPHKLVIAVSAGKVSETDGVAN